MQLVTLTRLNTDTWFRPNQFEAHLSHVGILYTAHGSSVDTCPCITHLLRGPQSAMDPKPPVSRRADVRVDKEAPLTGSGRPVTQAKESLPEYSVTRRQAAAWMLCPGGDDLS